MSNKKVDYAEPPIVEVAAGIEFEPLAGFLAPHFGLFWQDIRSGFPLLQTAAPKLRGDKERIDLQDVPVRCWFLSGDSGKLVQLQQDSIFFNWRRVEGNEPQDYPEFARIYPEFVQHLSTLRSFLENNQIGSVDVRKCELTYVNFIPFEQLETLKFPGDVLVDHRRQHESRILPPPESFSWNSNYKLPDQCSELFVRCVTARRAVGKKDQLIRLELTASGSPESNDQPAIDSWFSMAHDAIVTGFEDLTDKSIQQNVWRKK